MSKPFTLTNKKIGVVTLFTYKITSPWQYFWFVNFYYLPWYIKLTMKLWNFYHVLVDFLNIFMLMRHIVIHESVSSIYILYIIVLDTKYPHEMFYFHEIYLWSSTDITFKKKIVKSSISSESMYIFVFWQRRKNTVWKLKCTSSSNYNSCAFYHYYCWLQN